MTDSEASYLYSPHHTLSVELFMEFLAEYGVSLNDFMKTWDGVPHEH